MAAIKSDSLIFAVLLISVPVINAYSVISETTAEPNEFPSMVRLIVSFKGISPETRLTCSGVLIDLDYVLTAAHCLVTFNQLKNRTENATDVLLLFGKYDANRNREPGEQNATASRVYIHPNYSRASSNYDVAIIKLSKHLHETDQVRPIQLPDEEEICAKSYYDETTTRLDGCLRGVIACWDRKTSGMNLLQKFPVTIEEFGICLPAPFQDVKFCARGGDRCRCDLAAPLMCLSSPGDEADVVLIGIASQQVNQASPSNTSLNVYTRICRVLAWIRSYVPPIVVGNDDFDYDYESLVPASPTLANTSPISCGRVPDVENGSIGKGDSYIGSSRFVYCNRGFLLIGANTVTCIGYGFWSQPGTCTPSEAIPFASHLGQCLVPEVGKGHVVLLEDEHVEVGLQVDLEPESLVDAYREIVIKCQYGFTVKGNKNSICYGTTKRSWQPPPGTCVPVRCGQIPLVPHGRFEGSGTNVGSSRQLRCENGYRLSSGTINIVCLITGSWSQPGTCSKIITTCNQLPQAPENGFVENGTSNIGAMRQVRCRANYRLIGFVMVTCQANGTWSQPGQCLKITCGAVPFTLSNGHIGPLPEGHDEAVPGDQRTVFCSPGYELTGGNNSSMTTSLITCQQNGKWSSFSGNCTRIECGQLPLVHDGRFLPNEDDIYYVDDASMLRCDVGYEVIGPNWIRCQQNATWTEPGYCSLIVCGVTPTIIGGYIDGGASTYSSTRIVRCYGGYNFTGATSIECQANGQWSVPGLCRKITCGPVPNNLENGYVEDDENLAIYDIGTTRNVRCDDGYSVPDKASHLITCLISGKWSQPPVCQRINCSVILPQINFGWIESSGSYSFGASRAVQCLFGYELRGAAKVTCQSDGSWSQPGTCARMTTTTTTTTRPPPIAADFIQAAVSGNMSRVVAMLDQGVDINTRDSNSRTALFWAVDKGNLDVARTLVDRRADVDVKTKDGYTALIWAGYNGRLETVRLLLDHGGNINAAASDGNTALIWASYWGHLETVRLLLDRGADIEAKLTATSNYPGHNALMMAAANGKIDVVRLLLSRGADRNSCTYELCIHNY